MTMASGRDVPRWEIYDRLRKAREYAGLSQTQLADRTGLSRQTISNYEVGATKPSRANLLLWSMGTGVSLRWLTTGNDDGPGPGGPGVSTRCSSRPRWSGAFAPLAHAA